MFIAVVFSNLIFSVISYYYRSNFYLVKNLLKIMREPEMKVDATELNSFFFKVNLGKTIAIIFLNIFLFGLLFFVAFSFCAVYKQFDFVLLAIWLMTLVADFLIMEICLEFLIFIFYIFRNVHNVLMETTKFLVALKNNRSFY